MPIYNGGGGVAGITVEVDPTALKMASNLSDLISAGDARTNLDVYDTGTTDTTFLALAGGTMTGAITFDATGLQNINKGTFDNSLGGYNGVSLTCAVGYELNWQGGHLGNWYSGAYNLITIDSPVHITHVDGLTVESGMTVKGPMISDESATSGFTSTLRGAQLSFDGTGCYISGEETTIYGFSSLALSASGTISNVGSISFSDSTSQTTAGVNSDKSIANAFASHMWYASGGRTGVVNGTWNSGVSGTIGISDGTTLVAGFPDTISTLDTGSYWYVSINGTLSDIYIYSP